MSLQGKSAHAPQTSIPFSRQQATGRHGSSPHAVSRQPGHFPAVRSGHGAQFTPQYAIIRSVSMLRLPLRFIWKLYHRKRPLRKTRREIFTAI
jgi:hypothetical protein